MPGSVIYFVLQNTHNYTYIVKWSQNFILWLNLTCPGIRTLRSSPAAMGRHV